MNQFILGVDIGGTHITAAVVDLVNRRILDNTINRRHVDASGSVAEIIAGWSETMLAAMGMFSRTITHVGIAMPGPFDYENGIALMQNQDKYDALYGVNVKKLLAQALQLDMQHIKLQNDAPCFLKGEIFAGAAQGYSRAIGLTLGTGLGSAAVVEGEAWDAELWKSPFNGSIAEAHLSSRWFIKRFQELSGIKAENVKCIVEMLPAEPKVHELFDDFAHNLAEFIVQFAKQESPVVIILGGNIAKSFNLFGDALVKNLREQHIHVPVKIARLGEQAALLGAANLWQE